ncbi:hypothetical protein O53_2081 [Microcystis aeruginosa TAIHU98]|uniref:Uncharacterized protein n=1 Tax=Microcystis aeruginosa TAIHU98 TaxID=1134457 RepID=L7E4P9_MICAE|nr:hypothetical protein O53_2081 [Microcystis aeruginosa TAIHU98]ODV39374.1 hypothetical protein BFG60_1136 [Microcystis aeruginosa NIES-98]
MRLVKNSLTREKRGVLDFINYQSGVLLRSAFGIAIEEMRSQ